MQVHSVLGKEIYIFKADFKWKAHLVSPFLSKAQGALQKREWIIVGARSQGRPEPSGQDRTTAFMNSPQRCLPV